MGRFDDVSTRMQRFSLAENLTSKPFSHMESRFESVFGKDYKGVSIKDLWRKRNISHENLLKNLQPQQKLTTERIAKFKKQGFETVVDESCISIADQS